MDFILAMRFFIQDLNAQLRELQKELPIKLVRVYRSQLMSSNEVAMLYKSIGNLILISSFLSTSLSRQYALFILGDSHINDGVERVLFEIDADPRIEGAKHFADITEKSYFPSESEILFTLGSIFRIINIRQNIDRIHIIQMTLGSYNDHSTKPLFDYIINETKNDTSICALGCTLLKSGHFDEAQRIFLQTLMDTEHLRDDYSISTCFNGIGVTSAMKKDFNMSVDFLNKALQLGSQLFQKNDPHIARIRINLGNSLCPLSKFSEALESYTEALNSLHIAYNSEEHKEFAQCYGGMANICRIEAEYDKALELYRKAHCIYEKLLPSDHPALAKSYTDMGRLHRERGHYDQALANIECALSIEIKSLPLDHSDIATTYSNMGSALYGLRQNQKALECFEKANFIIRKKFSPTDQRVLRSEQEIDGAKHRLRVEAMQAEARSKNGNNMVVSSPFQSPLTCGGCACSKCGGCCDWNDPSGRYIKRPDAYCRHIYCYNPTSDARPLHCVSFGTRDKPFPGANFLCNCKERDWF
jgi:tetratricopeptide (TPR) repeat protein